MISENWIFLGSAIAFLGGLTYIADTLRGRVKPNRVSWGIWAVAPLIAFAAEIRQGVGLHSLMTFMVGFVPLLIFISSFFNKKAFWRLGRFDIWCGALSIAGLALWYLTRIGNVAIIFSILSDLIAGVPTLAKAYKYPETENYLEFSGSFINSVITILAIKTWNIEHFAFPVYIFLFDFIAIYFIKFRPKRFLNS